MIEKNQESDQQVLLRTPPANLAGEHKQRNISNKCHHTHKYHHHHHHHHLRQQQQLFETTIAKPLTIATLCCIALVYAASFSSGIYNEYVYNYDVTIASGPNGFRFKAKASLDILYASKGTATNSHAENEILASAIGDTSIGGHDSILVRLRISDPVFYSSNSDDQVETPLVINNKFNQLYNPDHMLYAHISTMPNGTAIVREVYTHHSDAITFKNIKKSILLNILPTSHHLNVHQDREQKQYQEYISVKPICTHDNNVEQPELFSPDSISQVNIVAKARKSPNQQTESPTISSSSSSSTNSPSKQKITLPVVFQTVDGVQNVTFRSRVFSQADSNMTTRFNLELVDQFKSKAHEKFDQAESIDSAIKLLDSKAYKLDSVHLEREKKICSNHHCDKTIAQLFQEYREYLTEESMASVESAISFLRLLDRLRDSKAGTSVQDLLSILKKSRRNQGVESSFLDVLAAARTKNSIVAALKHLKLTKSQNLDVAERFLSVISVATKTAAKMHLKRPLQSPYYYTSTPALKLSPSAKEQRSTMASLEFITREFLQLLEIPAKKWASDKLRWSSILTLSTLVNSYNQENDYRTSEDELNKKVEQLLINELKSCDHSDTDCRIVAIQAIGNVGHLDDRQFQILKQQVLEFGKRESNSAMKVLRDLLQNQAKDKEYDPSFYTNLKDFLLRIVYDGKQETTSRVLASEMIVRFVPNFLASEELLNHLPSFGNNELATMIYSRMQSLRPDSLARHHENWYWKSCIINGTSTSFVKTMARTDSLNASYGVNVELLNKGKVFKESSFDVFLDTKERTQDLFSLGIFARGLTRFASGDTSGDGDEDAAGDEDETTMAGMSLRLLGGYLRPYVFFTGIGELMSHIWHGTASEPTTAFNGDLLLIDHEEGYPLISGFIAEQQMRGVLSIDVSGRVKISWLWKKNSHSVVTTKASVIVQASQSIFTSYEDFFVSHLFSFGGQAMIDFVADAFFSPMPVRTCLQVTQPEFMIRYNSRRHDRMMTEKARRRITRRSFLIGAKSYSLNSENNKMCSALIDEL